MSEKGVLGSAQVVDMAWNVNSSLLAALYTSSSTITTSATTKSSAKMIVQKNNVGYLMVWDVVSVTRSASTSWNNQKSKAKSAMAKLVQFMDHSSPFTCVVCHPIHPSLFVVGTSDGCILLFDASSGESHSLTATSNTFREETYGHTEAITSLAWLLEQRSSRDDQSKRGGDMCLCSTGLDGRILYWKVSNKSKYPIRGFQLMRDSTPHNTSTIQSTTLLSNIGITTSVVAPRHGYEQVDAVFVGTNTGSILHVPLVDVAPVMPQRPTFLSMQWSLHALQALYRVPHYKREEVGRLVESAAKRSSNKSIQRNGIDLAAFYSASLPAKFLFPPIVPSIFVASSLSHVGPLIDLQCYSSIEKSYENNVVVSCGTDGGISLHYYSPSSRNNLSSTKVLIPPYMECKFTSATKLHGYNISILAVGTDDGKIHLYHPMKSSLFQPICSSAAHDDTKPLSITSLASPQKGLSLTDSNIDETSGKLGSERGKPVYFSSGDNGGNLVIWTFRGLGQ